MVRKLQPTYSFRGWRRGIRTVNDFGFAGGGTDLQLAYYDRRVNREAADKFGSQCAGSCH